ncbi:uncharacterized protein LOC132182784 [Corylus avellana]|uniref:uncharacterized protein LOC132182784 n=1 Tax=Corylus avellana TaxID=13451 RepID=UPI00286CA5D5|nr:uncharacterized protein LOC132182784 [Corylus avellana]
MLSTPFLMNLFMARKKGRGRGGAAADQLAAVKSAAWAWYQRGSGSEGKQMPEFDVMRTRRAPRPSVFKLEAIRIAEEAVGKGSQTPSLIRTDNSLLDRYEIASISRRLDCLIESSVSNSHRKLIGGDHDHPHENTTVGDNHHTIEMIKKKKKKMKGFWVRHAVTCGTREDVADARAFRDIRQPQKLAPPVVSLATCRPRATHAR